MANRLMLRLVPHEGINALDAVIQTFNGINAFRQQVKSTVRIHGVINSGGQAANIISTMLPPNSMYGLQPEKN